VDGPAGARMGPFNVNLRITAICCWFCGYQDFAEAPEVAIKTMSLTATPLLPPAKFIWPH
jgi:hypothetical protein